MGSHAMKVSLVAAIILLPALVAAQPIVTCQFDPNGSGDHTDRGFYVPNFPASAIGRVQLQFVSNKPGEHVFALTARDGTYDGPIIGTAVQTAILGGQVQAGYDPIVSFNFYGATVTAGHTVTFAVQDVRVPTDASTYMNVGTGHCSVPVWETEGTEPPLDTHRTASMGLTIYAPEASANTFWVPAVSHGGGAANSQWRSDVKILNRGAGQANVTLRLHEGSNPTRDIALAAGGEARVEATIDDVVAWVDPSFSGSAALEVISDQPLTIESRNYNLLAADVQCNPSATFGQLYDAYTPDMGLIAGQTAMLVGLVENSKFRTNIGLTNIGSTSAQATVSLCDSAGNVLATYDVSLAAGEWKQAYRPFNGVAHLSNLDGGYAKVKITAGNGVIAYASVVDWQTNDPTTVIGKL